MKFVWCCYKHGLCKVLSLLLLGTREAYTEWKFELQLQKWVGSSQTIIWPMQRIICCIRKHWPMYLHMMPVLPKVSKLLGTVVENQIVTRMEDSPLACPHSAGRWRVRERLKSLQNEQRPRAWKWPRAHLFSLLLLVTQMCLRFNHHPLPNNTFVHSNSGLSSGGITALSLGNRS